MYVRGLSENTAPMIIRQKQPDSEESLAEVQKYIRMSLAIENGNDVKKKCGLMANCTQFSKCLIQILFEKLKIELFVKQSQNIVITNEILIF